MSIYRHQEVGPPNSRSQPAEILNEVYAVKYTKEELYAATAEFLKNGIREFKPRKGRSWIFDQHGDLPIRCTITIDAITRKAGTNARTDRWRTAPRWVTGNRRSSSRPSSLATGDGASKSPDRPRATRARQPTPRHSARTRPRRDETMAARLDHHPENSGPFQVAFWPPQRMARMPQCISAAGSPLRHGPRMAGRRSGRHHRAKGRIAHGGHATGPFTTPPTPPLTSHPTVLTPRTDTLPRKNAGNTNRSATVRAPLPARPDSIFWVFFSLFLHTQGHLMRWTPPPSAIRPQTAFGYLAHRPNFGG